MHSVQVEPDMAEIFKKEPVTKNSGEVDQDRGLTTITSRLVQLLSWMHLFSKPGLIIWPIIGIGSVFDIVYMSITIPLGNIVDVINSLTMVLFVLLFASFPLTVYLLEQSGSELFSRKTLKRPICTSMMVLPFVIKGIVTIYIMVISHPFESGKSFASIIFWFINQLATLLGTTLYFAIPSFIFGVMASNLCANKKAGKFGSLAGSMISNGDIYTNEKKNRAIVDETWKELMAFRSLRDGAQFGLFAQFRNNRILAKL